MQDDWRSAAEGPRDRIFVRDYVRSVDIGVFAEEQGRPQRVRFSVVLEVQGSPSRDALEDVISYDTLVEAIDAELAEDRAGLLEILAERIASRCLMDRRARTVRISLEKLDRIDGALGVEILRHRS